MIVCYSCGDTEVVGLVLHETILDGFQTVVTKQVYKCQECIKEDVR